MIFASFGNSPVPFDRLARAIDDLAKGLDEEVMVQNGNTHYAFKYCKNIPFLEQTEYKTYLKYCSVAILQGGWGGISEASDIGCRLVVVPRLKGVEHYHDQEQLVRQLEKAGVCLGCYDVDTLPEIVNKARTYAFRPIKHGNASIIINGFISSLLKK